MTNQPSILARIGRWFMGDRGEDLPLVRQLPDANIERVKTRRLHFWHPFARRKAAIQGLQEGFGSLSELLSSVRNNLETQGRRQDDMLRYLSHLPDILQSMPESQRVQGETLRAIGQQLAHQVSQQTKLTEILAKINEANGNQGQVLEALHGRVETLSGHNQAISDNLRQVGTALEGIGRTSESSTQVLQQLQQTLTTRDGELERILQRQNTRFMIMIIVAIILSVAALVAMSIVGYLLLQNNVRTAPIVPPAPLTQPATAPVA